MSFRTQNKAFMIDFFQENENKLQDKIQEFVNYRKAIKKPIRKESFEAFMKKLIKLGKGKEDWMIEILDNSIANGWQGIFELKDKKPDFKETIIDLSNGAEEIFKEWDNKRIG